MNEQQEIERKDRIEEVHQLYTDVMMALKNQGIRRLSAVADLLDGKQLNESELAQILIEVFMYGRRLGRQDLKEEIARL